VESRGSAAYHGAHTALTDTRVELYPTLAWARRQGRDGAAIWIRDVYASTEPRWLVQVLLFGGNAWARRHVQALGSAVRRLL
jgi:hypothetical protein